MTNDLAIRILGGAILGTTEQTHEAVAMAIKALSADVQPVRHGYWIESDTDGFVCSVCRNGYRNQPTLMGKPMFEYCPVCGAKMDGEQNDDPSKI